MAEKQHRAAGQAAAAALGIDGAGTRAAASVSPHRPATVSSGTTALVGGESEQWSDESVTAGTWRVRLTCTGTGGVTAFAAAPSVVERVGLVGATDRWRTGRVSVRCGRGVTAFSTARPGRDGLALLVTTAKDAGLTGVAFTLERDGVATS